MAYKQKKMTPFTQEKSHSPATPTSPSGGFSVHSEINERENKAYEKVDDYRNPGKKIQEEKNNEISEIGKDKVAHVKHVTGIKKSDTGKEQERLRKQGAKYGRSTGEHRRGSPYTKTDSPEKASKIKSFIKNNMDKMSDSDLMKKVNSMSDGKTEYNWNPKTGKVESHKK